MHRLTITQPDDWHVHLRDGPVLRYTSHHTAAQFKRAIVMPNLAPPVTTVEQALAYRSRILQTLPKETAFEPLMTLYLTDKTSVEQVHLAASNPHVQAFKYYPAGATTNSDSGVTAIEKVLSLLEEMADTGMLLLVHGEVTDDDVDVFDREKTFMNTVLGPVLDKLPDLRVVFEHITTKDAVDFVVSAGDNVAATITPQHLIFNRNALFSKGIHPHMYCLPILKRETHRQALLQAATSGHSQFFIGTDSAPHSRENKESACGCAGIFSAHAAVELYAQIFESVDALDQLEAFASLNGPAFYRLPVNESTLTLIKEPWLVPESYPYGHDDSLIPLFAGENLHWKTEQTDDATTDP